MEIIDLKAAREFGLKKTPTACSSRLPRQFLRWVPARVTKS
jgi:hypothetical protein